MELEKDKAKFMLNTLVGLCLTDLKTKLNRKKIETLVTIQVHQKELVDEDLAKLTSASDFSWEKQTRIYWREEYDHCFVHITDWEAKYSYEYLGAKERLCITPLTDRCYITLA